MIESVSMKWETIECDLQVVMVTEALAVPLEILDDEEMPGSVTPARTAMMKFGSDT